MILDDARERERQLAYIDRQLARGDREPADVTLLRDRRDAILREANRAS